MVTSTAVFNDLAGVFVPIGVAGAVIAVLCALIALVAMTRGAEGVVGGAVAAWIFGALLSVAAAAANTWMPTLIAGAALIVALTVGGIVRGIVAGRPARVAAAEEATAVIAPSKPAASVKPFDAPRQPAFEIARAAVDAH
ncbi:hypothetical protein [Microbacterium sp. GXF0217]